MCGTGPLPGHTNMWYRHFHSTVHHAHTLGRPQSTIGKSTVGNIFQGLGLKFHPGYKTEADTELQSTGWPHFYTHIWHIDSMASRPHPETHGLRRNMIFHGPHRWGSSFLQG